jgi:hypothetical protein
MWFGETAFHAVTLGSICDIAAVIAELRLVSSFFLYAFVTNNVGFVLVAFHATTLHDHSLALSADRLAVSHDLRLLFFFRLTLLLFLKLLFSFFGCFLNAFVVNLLGIKGEVCKFENYVLIEEIPTIV